MTDGRERVEVHLDAPELGERRVDAGLTREHAGAQSVISFVYEPSWLRHPALFAIDPSLPLFEGEQFPPSLPGVLGDAAPDRWGRTLLERREALAARAEGRRPRHLDDWDFLVGVNDRVRMGALRLARPGDGVFVDDEPLSVPPVTRLRELEQLALPSMPRSAFPTSTWSARRRRSTASRPPRPTRSSPRSPPPSAAGVPRRGRWTCPGRRSSASRRLSPAPSSEPRPALG